MVTFHIEATNRLGSSSVRSRVSLLARLEQLQARVIELDGLLCDVVKSKVAARLTANLLETTNAIEAMLLVKP